MKKLLLFISILVVQFANAQTNIYHPFPDSSAHWNINRLVFCLTTGGVANENYTIEIAGDTLINSTVYHKLNTPFVEYLPTGNCPSFTLPGYKGAIRQDTSLKKVFFIPPTNNVEQLLYDFNLQIGDTVKGFTESFNFTIDTVISIDSVIVGSTYRKRWFINNCYNIYLIEGVGSTYGLLALSPGCITDADDYSIICFQQNGQSQYPITGNNCETITSLNPIENDFTGIKVSPNPATDKLILLNFTPSNHRNNISIFDALGKQVLSINNLTNNSIDISKLAKGLYLLKYVDRENSSSVSFVKE